MIGNRRVSLTIDIEVVVKDLLSVSSNYLLQPDHHPGIGEDFSKMRMNTNQLEPQMGNGGIGYGESEREGGQPIHQVEPALY